MVLNVAVLHADDKYYATVFALFICSICSICFDLLGMFYDVYIFMLHAVLLF
jgi:hypothetical protein